jgi:hypothetical protein
MSDTSDRDGGPYKVICEREETRDMHGLYYVEGQGRAWIRSNASEAICLRDDLTNAFNSGQRTAESRVKDEVEQIQERLDRALLRAREAESKARDARREGMAEAFKKAADLCDKRSNECDEDHSAPNWLMGTAAELRERAADIRALPIDETKGEQT